VIGEDKLGKIMKEMAKEVNHSGCKVEKLRLKF
jgi:glycine cleavage system regulatory protein